ncbi:hypothetical protein BE11_24800 [Sorangium cellulosum]|nr:hypothetical protein BE11_24800 [Sorangium cellulosum]
MNKEVFIVQGFVRFADGYPARGLRVAAFDRDLRSEELLGQAEVARDGSYRIEYSEGRFLKRERGTADLVAKAVDASDAVLAASPVSFNAPPVATIDLTIPASRCEPPSLFDKLQTEIAPLLGGVKLEELEEDGEHQDLTFIAGETGFARRDVARFSLAHRAPTRGLSPEFWFALLGGSIFSYSEQASLRAQLAAILLALPTLDDAAARKALRTAITRRDIGRVGDEQIDAWIRAFARIGARAALGDPKSPTFLGRAVDHARIRDDEKRERVARAYVEHGGLTPAALDTLQKEGGLEAAELDDLRTSFEIGELTRGDFSVVAMLKDRFDLRRPEQIRNLAKLSEHEWVTLIEQKHAAGEIDVPVPQGDGAPAKRPDAAIYGRTLDKQFREAFPTAAFAGGLERALKDGGARGVKHVEALSRFLDKNTDFDLLRTRVDEYLGERAPGDRRSFAKDEAFRRELEAVQRVAKIAPSFEAADAMLADGVRSAGAAYRMGESEFVRRYEGRGLSKEETRRAYRRAADAHAAALTIVGDLKALDAEALPVGMKTMRLEAQGAAASPDHRSLFQAGDMCHCEHCRSVLGPAAYFADLLMFLGDRKARNPARTVKDILFDRRPDLGYLELSCENANTTLPYVDVVCEVLERVVAAGKSDVELAGLNAIPAGAAAAKAAVATALSGKIDVGADFSLSQVDPADPDRWVVHGDAATYLLKKKAGPDFFAEVLPNSKASSDELRAYPAYIDAKAYDALRTARSPFSLPFDLFGAEVRATFEKSNLERWELMNTLRGPNAPNNPTDGDIAAEYFGISSVATEPTDEKRLILQADTTDAGQQEIWGEKGNPAWLAKVSRVDHFLRKTGLEYEELLALIDLPFINPKGDITIQHLDASCDTDKKTIQPLDAARLDAIHRFLRLWRKLDGWAMWELDTVIRRLSGNPGTLNEALLVKLHDFERLRARLGAKVTVEEVCALLGDLNVETHLVKAHEKRAVGLYQRLFLDKRLIQPLDPAFDIAAVNVAGPTAEKISGHRPVVLAALGVREADLDSLAGLTRVSDGQPYITDDLTLANLSFLWRHAFLARRLRFGVDAWRALLGLRSADLAVFGSPGAALALLDDVERLQASGFSPDELRWILAADRSAGQAVPETEAARFLTALRAELRSIRDEYDTARYDILNPASDVEALTVLVTTLLQELRRDEPAAQRFLDVLRDEAQLSSPVAGLPAGFDFPPVITSAIPIRHDEPAGRLRFTGLMTAAQRTTLLNDPLLAAVTGNASYQAAVEELFQEPRIALKLFDPVITAPLASLPAAVDFGSLPDAALAQKISYDAEERVLRFVGVLSSSEKTALDALSADAAYRNAVNGLFTRPRTGVFTADEIWLQDADLSFPLRDAASPANDNLARNLAKAATRALVYLGRAESDAAVVRQAAAQLDLTEALTRRLLTRYAIMPATLLAHLTGVFAGTSGVVDHATLSATFDGWYWATRVAALWKKWTLTVVDWERVEAIKAGAGLLDPMALPLNAAGAAAPLERFLRTSLLMRLRGSLPETRMTLLEVLAKLSGGAYATAADFAADVELANEAWSKVDVEALVASLDLAYPAQYLLAESWERLRRAFYFINTLNARASTVKSLAAATMTEAEARALTQLMRSKLGVESWLELSTEIQDALRERKRDALSAYLLSHVQPADPPTRTWENTNDLYSYYLLDVEMCSCQLTSRLVQASGSVQLFVQRCFMGLEPDVVVKADGEDGDTAWRWWKWMRKYRVWEANRKVFLWPENWIEPELKKDRSAFFRDLENELLQGEINAQTVENAFAAYLERLDGVAQLEIAGFYQQDDGDETIVHVFGRTRGAEPHLYYYRRYDYRQWTPWEKVDLDIQGDYLVPAVVNGRLFLFWPIFTEIPHEESNETVAIPTPGQTSMTVQRTSKKLRLQMAVSDYRRGKWTPKRVSVSYDESYQYSVELTRKHYYFYPVDRTATEGRFGVRYGGSSVDRAGSRVAGLWGAFEISGCNGTPEPSGLSGYFDHAIRPERASTGYETTYLKWVELDQREDRPEEDLTFESRFIAFNEGKQSTPVLMQTPSLFRVSPAWHLSYFDRLWDDGLLTPGLSGALRERGTTVGSWLPFFYDDRKRTFFVLPSLSAMMREGGSPRLYYPEIKREVRTLDLRFEGWVRTFVDSIDLGAFTPAQRTQVEAFVRDQIGGEVSPPFTDDQLRDLLVRIHMRPFHFWLGALSLQLFQYRQFHFKAFYHPFVCDFAKLVHDPLHGIPGLMKRETQLKNSGFSFQRTYQPTSWVVDPSNQDAYPQEVVDFSPDGAYSSYNWELFFHAPLFIANALSKNQRFEEARDWYHFIFNPIGVESATPGGSPTSKYWITKPFFETTDATYAQQRIDNILRLLAGDTTAPGYSAALKQALEAQVLDWRRNPFEPHRIANYRTVAYQKTVFMKYLDNLIAWGDYLFRQDSMESINEATQLYVLAAELLGPRPRKIPPRTKPVLESFNELEKQLDDFANALVEVENIVPVQPGTGEFGVDAAPLPMLYFCIPHNEKMLGYWDTVADRLYKIRHCMNIEGVVRQLSLFEPPIDPGALVKAVAGGADIGAALADLNAPLPLYRFNVLLQKANELCSDVRSLGAALLAALEKKDAEALGLLRQGQELRLLEAVKAVREKQIDEAKQSLENVKRARELAELKKHYYESREYMNAGEIVATVLNSASLAAHTAGTIADVLAGVMFLIPDFKIGASGFGGSPHFAVEPPTGAKVGQSTSRGANGLYNIATILDKSAGLAATLAGYARRKEEWDFQKDLATKEIEQIERQIAAAELRISIAEKELQNHAIQIENAKSMDAFMRSKYTNQELYQWQIGQISGVYFQSYRLAQDHAKRAERCFRFELGLTDSSYVQAGQWDSLKKGLLAGEKLQYDLRRLEAAYLEQNRRELELTKHVSLALLDPLALVQLRETGRCFFRLREEIFDLDYPGHYFRRIKSVSITLPCVTGPYTTVSATLRLIRNSVRTSTKDLGEGYARHTDDRGLPAEDTRFVENNIPVKAIATSSGQNDSGVFEMSFRDERYLPFEGAGVISEWSLELFNDATAPDFGRSLRQFDYGSITDAVVHVKYTAREDGGPFKNSVIAHLREYFAPPQPTSGAPAVLALDLRREYPTRWSRFLHPTAPSGENVFELEMSSDLFPWRDAGKRLAIDSIRLLGRCTDAGNYGATLTPPLPAPPPADANAVILKVEPRYGGLHVGHRSLAAAVEIDPNDPPVTWRIKVTRPGGGNLVEDAAKKVMEVQDLILVLDYRWK